MINIKHDPTVTANAFSVTVVILYVICRLAVSLFPGISMTIAQTWFHGLLVNSNDFTLVPGSFLLGLVSSAISAWLAGYLFAKVFNYFSKK